MTDLNDPFREARSKCPILAAKHQGENIPMILRHKDVRDAAKDWQTYSKDAPRRVPIPSEEKVRSVRQYPLEVDPPEHSEYRKLVEPFFLRLNLPEVQDKITALVDHLIDESLEKGSLEIIRDFAIPLQSYALAYLHPLDSYWTGLPRGHRGAWAFCRSGGTGFTSLVLGQP